MQAQFVGPGEVQVRPCGFGEGVEVRGGVGRRGDGLDQAGLEGDGALEPPVPGVGQGGPTVAGLGPAGLQGLCQRSRGGVGRAQVEQAGQVEQVQQAAARSRVCRSDQGELNVAG
ncbi:hypothetical protein ACFXPX_04690 [Kitasatospora sp. NPDC059146]|uniref:hypothetical protein n=1 Tax=unclassified Kitasatospora TaxID=2633591 RepID=UPI00368947E6